MAVRVYVEALQKSLTYHRQLVWKIFGGEFDFEVSHDPRAGSAELQVKDNRGMFLRVVHNHRFAANIDAWLLQDEDRDNVALPHTGNGAISLCEVIDHLLYSVLPDNSNDPAKRQRKPVNRLPMNNRNRRRGQQH